MKKRYVLIILVLLAIFIFGYISYTGKAIYEETEKIDIKQAEAFILLQPNSDKSKEVASLLQQEGAKVRYITEEAIIATNIPASLFQNENVKNIYFNGNIPALENKYQQQTIILAQAFAEGNTPRDETLPKVLDFFIEDDVRRREEVGMGGPVFKGTTSGYCDLPGTGTAVNAGFCDTTEFMAGDVAIAIILMESNGAIDNETEDWNASEKAQVTSEIINSLDWWIDRADENDIPLTFHPQFYYDVPTSYEPINHNSMTGPTCSYYGDEYLWKNEAFDYFGITEDCIEGEYILVNNLREEQNTDWAFTIFVVDSSNDINGKFNDGYFAYAWLGGPSFIMTLDNGIYGAEKMETISAHEMGHTFWALDQYGSCTCTQLSGYLNVENQNCNNGCLNDEPSLMRSSFEAYQNGQIDSYAKQQIGWRYLAYWMIPDVLFTSPAIQVNEYEPNPTYDTELTLNGVTNEVEGYPNNNYYHTNWPSVYGPLHDISVNDIEKVEFKHNGGIWQEADLIYEPEFAQYSFSVTPSKSTNGVTNTFKIKSTNSVGMESDSVSEEVIVKSKTKKERLTEISLPGGLIFNLPWQ
ncbi:MAG: hypothetical protein KKH88_01905 [Nanoarchaeota archaeon]|nr:hypothetical protein [Nanoarchaeota archaeon]